MFERHKNKNETIKKGKSAKYICFPQFDHPN